MNAPELTRAVTDALDLPLRAAVDRLEDPLREMARHHFGWDDSSGVPPSRHKGAILAYLCAGSDPEREWVRATTAAVAATVLLHGFLIHDDIIDNDRVRRFRPTCWTVYGKSAAIELGAAMEALAFELIAETDWAAKGVAAAARCARRMAAGQTMDIAHEDRDDITLELALETCRRKDATCTELFLLLGTLAVSDDPDRLTAAAEVGRSAGMAFSLNGFLDEIWGSPDHHGKLTLSDLRQRKKTPLITAALERLGQREGLRLLGLLDAYSRDDSGAQQLIALLDSSGARQHLTGLIDGYTAEAAHALPAALTDPAARHAAHDYILSRLGRRDAAAAGAAGMAAQQPHRTAPGDPAAAGVRKGPR
ncbi:polyprenyl synthetase family protein [Streptomyces uncialis]|uniref:polyprenyl synthetase family protein n=1 Tax=Streptomyces uncialis TaxID=1048205 RepID=UPI002E346576|nr:polyprenyl synthetase family protein [Streptomyces uncialis]